MTESDAPQSKRTLASFIFLSRWLQAPLYLGLIVAQAVYVYRFLLELWHLIGFVGGYETFVSRLRLEGHPDHGIVVCSFIPKANGLRRRTNESA